MKKKLKAALLGFGGMGHHHANQYKDQPNCELIAICDIDKKKFEQLSATINIGNSGDVSLKNVKQYLCYEDLIKYEKPDFIDICLPGYMHTEYAIRAMRDGFNVLCEKPMALNVKDADKMIAVSKETGKKLMIAQCLRFFEVFEDLRKACTSGKYGKLLAISMRRLSAAPNNPWYRDADLSGGGIMDLHLHDTDLLQYLFGTPEAVKTTGFSRVTTGIDESMTEYFYKNGPIIHAESSWCRDTWNCVIVAVFEKATLTIENYKLTISRLDKPDKVKEYQSKNGYWGEINYFAECILKNVLPKKCLPESTRESIRLILQEVKSARTGKKVKL